MRLEPDPVDDMIAVLREAMSANDLTLWSASGAHVFNGERALEELARSLLARQVLAPPVHRPKSKALDWTQIAYDEGDEAPD